MSFLIYLGIVISVYICSFQNEFTEEHLDKVKPFILIVVVALFTLGLLGSIVGR